MILLVFGFTVILVMAAVVIDISLWLSERRDAQRVADLAALAGAQDLPDDDIGAIASALLWAEKNSYEDSAGGVTVTVETLCKGSSVCENVGDPEPDPCSGSCDSIRVVVSKPASLIFTSIFGIDAFDIEAGASARVTEGDGLVAIWANNSSCSSFDALLMAGSGVTVAGKVHSNSNITVSGSNNDFEGAVEYDCTYIDSGQNNTYASVPTLAPPGPPPANYDFADFPCMFWLTTSTALADYPDFWLDATTLKPGVYCSITDIDLSGADISGNVTLVAMDEVKVSGSGFHLSGYFQNVLLFSAASHDSAIDASGSGGEWVGLIHAPNGRVKMAGQGLTSEDPFVFGSIVADTVSVSGSNFIITATELPGEGWSIRLVE